MMWLSLCTGLLLCQSSHAISGANDQYQLFKGHQQRFTADLFSELRPKLSSSASIVLPNATADWSLLLSRPSFPRVSPGYLSVVEVATERDIEETVKYANSHDLPFLAVSTGHGWTTTLNELQGGLQISMRKMQSVTLGEDGGIARLGGGTTQNVTVKALGELGKRAVTGLCECTSVIGPAMGAGHSLLQSQHGFAADNIVSARVVLGNGSTVTASKVDNADLFWALRGAGHNFGIVSSFEIKAYDIPEVDGLWTFANLTFTHDKLESFFDTWSRLEQQSPDPGRVVLHGLLFRNSAIDPANPVISLWILHEGHNAIADSYVTAFKALMPATFDLQTNIPWSSIHDVGGWGSPEVCAQNLNFFAAPSSFKQWPTGNMRDGFELYSEFTAQEKFKNCVWLLESYGRGAVERVPVEENAVAQEERSYHLVTGPNVFWEGNDEVDKRKAEDFAAEAKRLIREGTGANHSYVNYALGNEDPGEMYGHNEGRLANLRTLKEKWDPENRFGFYNVFGWTTGEER